MRQVPIAARKLHNQLLFYENPIDGQDMNKSADYVAIAARELLESEYGLRGRSNTKQPENWTQDRKRSLLHIWAVQNEIPQAYGIRELNRTFDYVESLNAEQLVASATRDLFEKDTHKARMLAAVSDFLEGKK